MWMGLKLKNLSIFQKEIIIYVMIYVLLINVVDYHNFAQICVLELLLRWGMWPTDLLFNI